MKTPCSRLLVVTGLTLLAGYAAGLTAGCAPPEADPGDILMDPDPDKAPADPNRLVPSPAEAAAAAALVSTRLYETTVPRDYSDARSWPLVVLLHGYGASAGAQDLLFGLGREAGRLGYLLALPDGTVDSTGKRFWNATDACCDFARAGVDDVGYVDAIIDDVSARYAVDPRRIFLIGHSNGGFMAHRMACDRSNRIAAIVSLAGATQNVASRCAPSEPVSVLQVHGTADATIDYNGGVNGGAAYPGAATTVARWATYNRCSSTRTAGASIDIDMNLEGAETTVERHDGCMGGAAELWTITGGSHAPGFNAQWSNLALAWLLAHPKPGP